MHQLHTQRPTLRSVLPTSLMRQFRTGRQESAHTMTLQQNEASDADYFDWMNRNLKIGTPSDDGEYAWDEQTSLATPDASPVTYVDVIVCSQYDPYSSTFTRPMPVPVTPLAPIRQVAGLLQSAATCAPMNPASRRPHSMVQSRTPLPDNFSARWREIPTQPLTPESPVPLTELSSEANDGMQDLKTCAVTLHNCSRGIYTQ